MADVSFEKTGNVTGLITLKVTKDELNQQITDELKKQRKKVSMKGFRKGKTPLSTLRKMMGNQILGEVLDKTIREGLFGYIEDNDIKIIFSPQPVDEENTPTITATSLQDVDFKYELALEPEFEIKMPDEAIDLYVLDVTDTFLDEQIERMLKGAGTTDAVEDGEVEDNDVLDVTFTEAGPVEDKITNSTKLYVDALSDEGKQLFLGKKVGDVVTVTDLKSLEKESTDTYVAKYFLGLEDGDTDLEGKSFEVTVDGISRLTPGEMDEAFFAEFDPSGEVTDEAALRAKITADNKEGFARQGEGMANFAIQKALVEGTEIELPTAFMERINEDEDAQPMDEFERAVKWMLIRNKVADDADIKIEYEDIKAEATESLIGMLGGQRPDFLTDEFIDNYVQRMLSDDEQRQQLTGNAIQKKIMNHLRGTVTLVEKPVDADEFNQVIQDFNAANTPAPAPAVAEEE